MQSHKQNIFRKVHPEVCFRSLNGKALNDNKKNKKGQEERISICKKYFSSVENLLKNAKTNDVKPDDILDALCAAITAKIGDTQGYKTLPEEPQKDSCNLPIEMIITPPNSVWSELNKF